MFAIERFVATEEGGGETQQQHDVDEKEKKQDKLALYLARVQQRRGDRKKESKMKRKRDLSATGQVETQEKKGIAPTYIQEDKEKTAKRKVEEEHAVETSEGKQGKKDRKREEREERKKRPRTEDKAEQQTSLHSSPTAAAEAPSPSSSSTPSPAPRPTQRSSGLEMIRRMLSGHMAKPSRTTQAQFTPPGKAAAAAAETVEAASAEVSIAPSSLAPAATPTAKAAVSVASVDNARNDEHREAKAEKKEKNLKPNSVQRTSLSSLMDMGTTPPLPSPPPSLPPAGTMSVANACTQWGLDPRLLSALATHNIRHFFPVQARVLPFLLPPPLPPSTSSSSFLLPGRDAIVCAPTGSGKTLVYVLILLQALSIRRVGRLRGLVLVPTRDLAMQVFREFMSLAPSVGVTVALAIGQTDFEAEQKAMQGRREDGREGPREGWVDVVVATPGRLMDHMDRTRGFTLEHLRYLVLDEVDRLVNQSYQGWAQRVHEAAYVQRPGTFGSTAPSRPASSIGRPASSIGERKEGRKEVEDEEIEKEEGGSTCTSYIIHPTTIRLRSTHHAAVSSSSSSSSPSLQPFLQPSTPLRKLLFSATFTSNPQKLARLNLRNPRYFSIDGHVIDPPPNAKEGEDGDEGPEEGFIGEEGGEGEAISGTPATLKEEVVVCSGKDKPLVLLALLLRELQAFSSLPLSRPPSPPLLILIFTSSLDSTHRLCRLLQLCTATVQVPENIFALSSSFPPSLPPTPPAPASSIVCEFSSSLSQPQRAALLQRCLTTGVAGREGGVRVLVASDGMARGIDLPNVTAVVNYDCPRQAKTYIHRVGRTARAGREGRSVTLLKPGQEREFERLRKGVGDGGKWKRVGRLEVGRLGGLEPLLPGYKKALRGLRDVMGREKGGRLKATEGMSEEVVREVLRLGGASGGGMVKGQEEEEDDDEKDEN